jgi:NAD(P)-dependent dehydrogenase (short-subunit alcohol dehydrogenase family)
VVLPRRGRVLDEFLKGKTALVTGGGTGIALAIAKRLIAGARKW